MKLTPTHRVLLLGILLSLILAPFAGLAPLLMVFIIATVVSGIGMLFQPSQPDQPSDGG